MNAPVTCPYCAVHPAMTTDNAALVAVHCASCAASVLPAASTVQLVTQGLGLQIEAFRTQVERGAAGPFPCPACHGVTHAVTVRFRVAHVCAVCGAMALPGGMLHTLTAGRFGHVKAADPAAAATSAADTPVVPEATTGPIARALTNLAYAGNARKMAYIALSLIFFVIVGSISATQRKPIKLGKDGLPVGNLGMREDSAKALRETMAMYGGFGGGPGTCPDDAKPVATDNGYECRLGKVLHGLSMENTCDEEGRGRIKEGNWRNGRKHGRFVEKNCEGEVVSEVAYEDDLPQGEVLEHFPDGKVKKRETYAAGKLHGAYYEYHPNGKLAVEGFYQAGQPAGRWVYTSPEGRVLREETR
ncbi:MAG: hypothetical protein HY904_08525 [Deltaproteobacteria bacterium]|nr:hypothetical protein [Deltaproteobacteria bacterium]